MTPADYLNPHLFPLSTQEGLSLEQQLQLDAVNYDEYAKTIENREQLDGRERAIGRELEAKHAARANVLQQAKAVQQGGQNNAPQGPDGRPLV